MSRHLKVAPRISTNILLPESPRCFAGARSRSQRLRSTVDDLLNTEYNNLHQNWTDTNKAFQQRISSTQSAHTNLRSHLSRTMQEIFEQEKHMNQLQGAIRSMVRSNVDSFPFRRMIFHFLGKQDAGCTNIGLSSKFTLLNISTSWLGGGWCVYIKCIL